MSCVILDIPCTFKSSILGCFDRIGIDYRDLEEKDLKHWHKIAPRKDWMTLEILTSGSRSFYTVKISQEDYNLALLDLDNADWFKRMVRKITNG